MNRMEQIAYLNRRLLEEMPEYRDQAARFSREERDVRGQFFYSGGALPPGQRRKAVTPSG